MVDQAALRPVAGMDDAFGVRATGLRMMQRQLAELFEAADYQEVIPPVIERPQSLASGAGRFLSEQTIIFSDPADAGQLAIRPDITPQVARLVATRLRQVDVLRLHYSGPVVLARSDGGYGARQQWQTGLELFGVAGLSADIEVLRLAAEAMGLAGFVNPTLQVGHIGLLRALLGEARDLTDWVALLRRRSPEDLQHYLLQEELVDEAAAVLLAMVRGEADQLFLQERADINADFSAVVSSLVSLRQGVESLIGSGCKIVIDGALTPRFLYHSGIIFCGYAAGKAAPVLHGGRYDTMVAAHGRDLPATGFSCDLWQWI
ncbi:MAG: ATP phosphoribosyltransferase regulatory subunit [Mariprofundales bacterium]|nr:ATP phosphoribosyltransferase regulatory subunit [Mariprofundales bacterium]